MGRKARGLVAGLPLALRQHGAGLLAGVAVDEVVAEEDLRRSGVGSTVLGHVLRADVYRGGIRLFNEFHGGSLGVGASHTVGLALGGLDDEVQAAVVGRLLVQLEGEGLTLAHDGGAGGILHAHQLRRSHLGLATAGDNPVVEAGEQVGTGDLCLGAQDAAPLLREGRRVPGAFADGSWFAKSPDYL